MLNIKLEDGLPITVSQARTILEEHTNKFGVFIDLDRLLEHELRYTQLRNEPLKIFKEYAPDLTPTQYAKVRTFVMDTWNVPERLFYNNVGKIAMDADIRERLLCADIHEDAKRFIKAVNDYLKNNYMINYLNQYITLPICNSLSDKGHRMVIAKPEWSILTTSRISAKEPSIQNIARELKDIICCPEGWKLIRADSGQIEPRITYSHYIKDRFIRELIILYNDAYYGLLHYCSLPEYIYEKRDKCFVDGVSEGTPVDPNLVIKKLEITDEIKAKRKSLKVLALAANYGSGLAGADQELAARYTDRIVNNPARKEWELRVKSDVNNGAETFHSAFGTPITPEETAKYSRYTQAWNKHMIRCGINNPIQTTASDLMVCSVNKANEILSKTKYSYIAYYKHDEGAFYIHESEKSVIDELSEVTAYQVYENGRPWIPIYSEVEEGQLLPEKDTVLDW